MKFKRGDKVTWWSAQNGRTSAIFVEYDRDFPSQYCILAIPIGVRGNRMTHTFRWPVGTVALFGEGRTMNDDDERRSV